MGNDIDELAHLQTQWQRARPSALASGKRLHPMARALSGSYGNSRLYPRRRQAAVNRYADSATCQIKLYSSLSLSWSLHYQALPPTRLPRQRPCPNGMVASQFVEEGADELQHINLYS